jgi:hypothetical protein
MFKKAFKKSLKMVVNAWNSFVETYNHCFPEGGWNCSHCGQPIPMQVAGTHNCLTHPSDEE